MFINACGLLSALLSLSQFGRGKLSLVTISFYELSLLFGPCCLSEFTLAGCRSKREKIVVKVTDKDDCKVIRKFQVGSFFVKISGRFCYL